MWCDRQPLISEEIDEHIRDGQKIWDPEFSGDPVPNCRRPKVALVRLHIVELTEEICATPKSMSLGGKSGWVLLWPFGPQ